MVSKQPSQHSLGRYVMHDRIASGGMAAVHFGRLVGPRGFARTVAVKRLHPALTDDREAVLMLVTEARLTARLHHPNVASTLDVVIQKDDVFVIMDYVHGESLARLLAAHDPSEPPPAPVVSAILCGVLRGLHAAHEARGEQGEPLEIVHRDVSPQNVVVGADGLSRLIDFGIAKARVRARTTSSGQLKGKLCYLAPEQVRGESATRRTDVYAAGVVLWEALTGRTLFEGDSVAAITEQILVGLIDPPSKYVPELAEGIDRVVLRAVETNPKRRYSTAEEMAAALERAAPPASPADVGAWVLHIAGESLRRREKRLRTIESSERQGRARSQRVPRRAWFVAVAVSVAAVAVLGWGPTGAAWQRGAAPAPQAGAGVGDRQPARALAPEAAVAPPPASQREAVASRATASRSAVQGDDIAPRGTARSAASARRPSSGRTSRAPGAEGTSHGVDGHRVRPRAGADDCEPPYIVNAAGIRIYKRRCLLK